MELDRPDGEDLEQVDEWEDEAVAVRWEVLEEDWEAVACALVVVSLSHTWLGSPVIKDTARNAVWRWSADN